MKILHATTPIFDLTMSATLAVAIHTAVLGFGIGFLDRDPAPIMQNPDQVEYIAVLPQKKSLREPVEKREIVKKETVRRTPVSRERRIPSFSQNRSRYEESASTRSKKRMERQITEKPLREKVATVKHEEPLKPEEKLRIQPSEEESAAVAYSRYPKPLLKRGWKAYYPKKAERMGWEGRVEVLFTISPEGRVHQAEVLGSSGYSILDKSMVEQLKSIRFQPALSKAGVPVEWRGTWGWNFNLEDSKGFFSLR